MARTGSEYNTLNGSFSAAKGDIRLLNVTAGFGGKSYMNFLKVPDHLEKFCKELNQRRGTIDKSDILAIYELSFWAHYQLVTIHPWADGNGRTTRLLMNLLQLEYGVLPMKVMKEEKGEYIQALIDARENDDVSIFIKEMVSLHEKHLRQDIIAFTDSIDKDTYVAVELTERQKLILSIIKNNVAVNVAVNTKYLSEQLNVNRKTIQRELSVLREHNLIEWVGSAKTGHWELAKGKKERK